MAWLAKTESNVHLAQSGFLWQHFAEITIQPRLRNIPISHLFTTAAMADARRDSTAQAKEDLASQPLHVFKVSCSTANVSDLTHTTTISLVHPSSSQTPSILHPVYELRWSAVKLTISPNKVTIRKIANALTGSSITSNATKVVIDDEIRHQEEPPVFGTIEVDWHLLGSKPTTATIILSEGDGPEHVVVLRRNSQKHFEWKLSCPSGDTDAAIDQKALRWKSGAGFGNLELWEDRHQTDSTTDDGSGRLGNKIAIYQNDASAPWNPLPSVGGGTIQISPWKDGTWSERAVDEIVLTCTAIVHLKRRLGSQMVPHW
jgi:hypothetical protein